MSLGSDSYFLTRFLANTTHDLSRKCLSHSSETTLGYVNDAVKPEKHRHGSLYYLAL